MTGVAVMVVGVWCVAGDGRDVMLALAPTPADTPTLIHLAYGLVGAGGVVLLTSILGVWAALRENKCGLGMYVTIVVLVITGEVAVGVLGVLYQLRAVNSLGESLTDRLKTLYGSPGHETFTLAVDYVQYQYVTIVVLVITGEVAVGVLGVLYQLRAVNSLGESLTDRLKTLYGSPGHETFTLAVDYVQYQNLRG
ncbi:tetraspanin-36-like [Penaeus japonicus]|uniref:tetraspanin-36-like n=1 Tax=Penaeus japonicus TaxID=27405 RepID=UPI001C714C65|nr:tetraspanin-36-like [Penaeus japonicus]